MSTTTSARALEVFEQRALGGDAFGHPLAARRAGACAGSPRSGARARRRPRRGTAPGCARPSRAARRGQRPASSTNSPERTSMTSPRRCGSSVPRPSSATFVTSAGGQVVDHEEAEVLEHVGRRRAAGSRHPGDDGDVERHARPHRRTVLTVQLREHRTTDLLGEPRDRHQFVFGQGAQALDRTVLLEQAGSTGGPETGHVVEHRLGHRLAPQLAVVGDGEAVGFVAHLLQQVEGFGVARDAHRIGLSRHVHLFEPLGEAGDRDVLEPQLLEHAHRHAQLALAAVDQHQVGRVGEALAAARAFVAVLQVATEAAGEHLLHRREVVLRGGVTHLEAPVVGALRAGRLPSRPSTPTISVPWRFEMS